MATHGRMGHYGVGAHWCDSGLSLQQRHAGSRRQSSAERQPMLAARATMEYLLSHGTDGTLATCLQQLDEHGDRAGVGHVDALLLANRKVAQRARDMRSILGLQRQG